MYPVLDLAYILELFVLNVQLADALSLLSGIQSCIRTFSLTYYCHFVAESPSVKFLGRRHSTAKLPMPKPANRNKIRFRGMILARRCWTGKGDNNVEPFWGQSHFGKLGSIWLASWGHSSEEADRQRRGRSKRRRSKRRTHQLKNILKVLAAWQVEKS